MKKLDEIVELMSDEMADFKVNLDKLQLLNKELEKKSIPISTEALENIWQQFLTTQNERNSEINRGILGMEALLNKAVVIPKYILILFSFWQLISILLLIYFIIN